MQNKTLHYLIRFGIFMTFLGHGAFAWMVKYEWIPFLTNVGFSENTALILMPYIGILDFIVAIIILIYPIRIVVIWAVFWAFTTALMRPLTGYPIWDFVERGANWMLPLVLLIMIGFPKRFKDLFYV